MLLTSTTVNGAVSNDSNNNITMSVGNTVIANVNSSGIFFESGKKAIYTGAVLQVVQVVKTDAFAGSLGATWADVSGMSASITPTSTSNKILVTVDMKGSGGQDYSVIRARLLRGNTAIYVGDAASSRPQSMGQFYIASGGAGGGYYLAQLGGTFLDSPATTSSVTYKVQIGADGTSQVVFVNRTQGDRDSSVYDSRVAATITLMEIAG
jgi:hypothetical protein